MLPPCATRRREFVIFPIMDNLPSNMLAAYFLVMIGRSSVTEIYLDFNATTPLEPRVAEAMWECEQKFPANPSSQHAAGRRARQALDDASEAIAALLGVRLGGSRPDRLVFTSGGTEANNLAVLGLCDSLTDRLIVPGVEHSSLLGPANELARRGHPVASLQVDGDGRVDLDHLEALLANETRLVSIQSANHETGVVQPVAEAAAICSRRGVLLHTEHAHVPVAHEARGLSGQYGEQLRDRNTGAGRGSGCGGSGRHHDAGSSTKRTSLLPSTRLPGGGC